MRHVIFQEHYSDWRAGQTAEVDDATATKAIKAGAAVELFPGQNNRAARRAAVLHAKAYLDRRIRSQESARLLDEMLADEAPDVPEDPSPDPLDSPDRPAAPAKRRPARTRRRYQRTDLNAEDK